MVARMSNPENVRQRSPALSDANFAIVALGSNLGDSINIVTCAMDRLQAFSEGSLVRSSLWRTAPIDCPPGSTPFINAVVAFLPCNEETPETLLTRLQALEKEFGRRPKEVLNEPRPLDLDLIAWGRTICSSARLTLPHPRAHLRAFVLGPLSEIAPDLVLPGHNATVRELRDRSSNTQDAHRVPLGP